MNKKIELTPAQQYHKALHAMPSAIAFNAAVNYGKTNFKYVDFKALRDAVLPVFDAHDLSIRYTTQIFGDAIGLHGQVVHKDGEVVNHFALPLRNAVKPQDLGSELTYYKRYILAALSNVVSDADNDCNFAEKAVETEKLQQADVEKSPFKPRDGVYHPSALTVHPERIGGPDELFQLILTELKQADDARDMWSASGYAPPKPSNGEMIGAIFLLKKLDPSLYAELRVEAGALFGSDQ
tara:strand:+ start:11937 stop:12650 length:714 start_codon:yes stop_codon:yes gene_type:complete